MDPQVGATPIVRSNRQNRRRVYLWGGLWLLPFLSGIVMLDFGLFPSLMARVAFIAVTSTLCIGFVFATARFIRQAEEPIRRIALESLAIAFGGAVVLISSFILFVKAGGQPTRILDVWVAMVLVWLVAQAVIEWRQPGAPSRPTRDEMPGARVGPSSERCHTPPKSDVGVSD